MKKARRRDETTVLVFHTSFRSSWNEMQDGIYRYAQTQGWTIFVAEHEMERKAIEELLAFWRPDGILVEGAMDEGGVLLSDVFGETPVVYLACDSRRLAKDALRVSHDSVSLGRTAAREFLSQGLTSFAESLCEHTQPTLSSIRPNFTEAGLLAASLLDARLMAREAYAGARHRFFAADSIVRRQSTRRLPRANAAVSKAMEIVRLRACGGLKPRDVFAELGVSRRIAEMRFRELTGHSVQEEINRVRLARVKELLARPGVPVESIASRCGWKSTAQLRVLFKSVEGLPLRQWRQRFQKAEAIAKPSAGASETRPSVQR